MEENWKEALTSEKAGLEARLTALGEPVENEDGTVAAARANLTRRIGEVDAALGVKAKRGAKETRPAA